MSCFLFWLVENQIHKPMKFKFLGHEMVKISEKTPVYVFYQKHQTSHSFIDSHTCSSASETSFFCSFILLKRLHPFTSWKTGGKPHDAFIKNKPLHLIRAPVSNWRSAVNILNNQCHPSPTPQATAINPSCSSMPWLTKMVALL